MNVCERLFCSEHAATKGYPSAMSPNKDSLSFTIRERADSRGAAKTCERGQDKDDGAKLHFEDEVQEELKFDAPNHSMSFSFCTNSSSAPSARLGQLSSASHQSDEGMHSRPTACRGDRSRAPMSV